MTPPRTVDPKSWVPAVEGKPQPRRQAGAYPPPSAPSGGDVNEIPVVMPEAEPEPGQREETAYAAPRKTYAVLLPSKGKFYDNLPDGVCEIYPLTAAEDKILSDMTADNITEIFDAVLARCIKSKISPADLIETDRYYLLLMLRAQSLGEEFEFPYECPFAGCKHPFLHTAMVPSDMPMVEGNVDEEPFYVDLPKAKQRVGLRFLRGADMNDIARYRRVAAPLDGEKGDPAFAYARIKAVVSVDGNPIPDTDTAMEWYLNLSLRDVRAIQKTLADAASGVSNLVKVPCPKCGKESVTRLPLSPMYFFE